MSENELTTTGSDEAKLLEIESLRSEYEELSTECLTQGGKVRANANPSKLKRLDELKGLFETKDKATKDNSDALKVQANRLGSLVTVLKPFAKIPVSSRGESPDQALAYIFEGEGRKQPVVCGNIRDAKEVLDKCRDILTDPATDLAAMTLHVDLCKMALAPFASLPVPKEPYKLCQHGVQAQISASDITAAQKALR